MVFPQVAIILGSESDAEQMKGCREYLDWFGIKNEQKVLSAHRTPDQLISYVNGLHEKEVKIIIAAAGMAAHLAGVVAAKSHLPVIGVPMAGSALNGVDALYSMVQMPAGVPVATMAIGNHGGKNAAVFAARILALTEPRLDQRLKYFIQNGCKI